MEYLGYEVTHFLGLCASPRQRWQPGCAAKHSTIGSGVTMPELLSPNR